MEPSTNRDQDRQSYLLKAVIYHYAKPLFFSSLACFSAMVLALLLHHVCTYVMIKSLGYEANVSHWWLIASPLDTEFWSLRRVLVVNGSGSLVCFILSFFIINFSKRLEAIDSKLRIFFLWFSINCLTMLNANIILGIVDYGNYATPFYNGFTIIYTWMYFPKVLVGILVGLSIIIQFFISRVFVNEFLFFVGNKGEINSPSSRVNSLINIGIFPLLLSGPIYICLSGYPVEFYFNSIRVGLILITMSSIYMVFVSRFSPDFEETMRVENGINQPLYIISVFSFLILIYWRFF